MKHSLVAVAVLASALSAMAPATVAQSSLLFGIGIESCASWTRNSQSEYQGSVWLLGFWSGANSWGEHNGTGVTTDALGVIESVKAICREDPAMTLADAVSKLYRKFVGEGR